jgi:hypothetical protein
MARFAKRRLFKLPLANVDEVASNGGGGGHGG